MSRVLPCPECGDNMWDNQTTCGNCKETIDPSDVFDSLIEIHREVLDIKRELQLTKGGENE